MAPGASLTLVLTGCESTGKTTLAKQLACHFEVPVVPEVARSMMTPVEEYTEEFVLKMAQLQHKLEIELRYKTTGLLIVDTDLTVYHIWCQNKFGQVAPWLEQHLLNQSPRQYLLMTPDLPWAADPLRESQFDLQRLHTAYQRLLMERELDFELINGVGEARFNSALSFVENWLAANK